MNDKRAMVVGHWVPVEEKLPDPVTDARLTTPLVLIVIERDNPRPYDKPEVRMAYYDLRREVWRLARQTIPAPTVEDWMRVTHWMLLPEPPSSQGSLCEGSRWMTKCLSLQANAC